MYNKEDKPQSMTLKEWIIRNMSTRMNIQERIIESVVNHQFSSALDAIKEDKETIEFSGFGKFCFNRKKVGKKMQKMLAMKEQLEEYMNDENGTPQRKHTCAMKLVTLNKDIELLKPKL